MILRPRLVFVLAAFGVAVLGMTAAFMPGFFALRIVASGLTISLLIIAGGDAIMVLNAAKPDIGPLRIEQPSLGKPFSIDTFVRLNGSHPTFLTISLEEPRFIRYSEQPIRIMAVPGRETPIHFEAIAERRGQFTVERAFLEMDSRLRFYRITAIHRLGASARVLPSLADLASARRLAMARGRRDGPLRKNSRTAAACGEYSGLREYTRGEDARRIDWKSSAKSFIPLVREKKPDDAAVVAFAIDSGRLMLAERQGKNALDSAMAAMLACADAVLRSGDHVCSTVFADSILGYVPPSRSRSCLPVLARFASEAVARKVESDYRGLARHLGMKLPKRSLVVIVTEASDTMPIGDMDAAISELSRRNAVVLAILRDTELEALADTKEAGKVWEAAAAAELLNLRDTASTLLSRRATVAVVKPEELSLALTGLYRDAKSRNAV